MFAFVQRRALVPGTDGDTIYDRWGSQLDDKPLARWADPTRIVINKDAKPEDVEHLSTFLALYKHEKHIGVSTSSFAK